MQRPLCDASERHDGGGYSNMAHYGYGYFNTSVLEPAMEKGLLVAHTTPRIPALPKTGQCRGCCRVMPGLAFHYTVLGQL